MERGIMATSAKSVVNPIALQPGEGEALWFFGALATIKASSETTAGRMMVMEHLAPQGSGAPVHVHHREDEWFYVIEGELTFWIGGKIIRAPAGAFVYGPRDIPHTYTVTSPQARSLVVTEPAGFEKFVRALSEPATARTIPPASVPLPGLDRIKAAAAESGLEILGPPGIPS
jgi:mannose-6-phosphate isomerase-like protein (cupin superfamily)